VLAALLAWWGWPLLDRQRTRDDARASGLALRMCLAGRASLDESALRGRTITSSLTSASAGDRWPDRCRPAATALADALARLHHQLSRCDGRCCADDPTCQGAGAALEGVTALRRAIAERRFEGADAVGTFERLQRLRLVGDANTAGNAGGSAAPAAPTVPRLLSASAALPLSRTRSDDVLTDPPTHADLSLLFHRRGRGHRLCDVDLGHGTGDCQELAASVPAAHEGRLLARQRGAARLLFARGATPGSAGLFRTTDGARLRNIGGDYQGGYSWREGHYAVLVRHRAPDGYALLRGHLEANDDDTEPLEVRPLDGDRFVMGPFVQARTLVWGERGAEGVRVVARELGADTLGPPEVLIAGLTPDVAQSLQMCGFAKALTLVFVAGPAPGRDVTLLFGRDGRWSKPVTHPIATRGFGLTCTEQRTHLSWIQTTSEEPLRDGSAPGAPIRGRYVVQRLRCTPAGCQPQRVELELERHSRTSRYAIVDLDDSMAIVWRSPLGDVRMRLGPLEALASTPTRALFDDAARGGFDWDRERGGLFARGPRALMVLRRAVRGDGLESYGLVVDATGAARMVTANDGASPQGARPDGAAQ
jgi:hypothetical protein